MAKKTFEEIQSDPTLAFASQETKPEQVEQAKKVEAEVSQPIKKVSRTATPSPKGYKLNPLFVELRDHRLQLLIPASLSDAIKRKAKKEKVTINEICNRILTAGIFEN